ncbi:ABC transporter ATP-binding protein [Parapedobacter koreensis]|uniref:ABC-2 type transport system ATP-binding protein n=1 Tax=Parapedobacter koreensis TaxID=332977 RepID=A0A1H7Q337_9SPHI|nr:ABC transporter ATP-binding protein [Parapedobacter koreensis]SEL42219.1 ABC-2 type transport system ATP-binding protein [Parapedobacter koreensis]
MLKATHLSKVYQGNQALIDLNLDVQQGEICCLLGQNGAGKTTTINLFLGFIQPSAGEASVAGLPVVSGSRDYLRHLAYIPEVVHLYAHMSALENLDFFSRLAGFRYSVVRQQEFLERAGLQPEAFERRLGGFSKGMRQKVGIAIAIAKDAQAILMDEPTSGLDPRATEEFSAICKQLAADQRTILMATHDIFNAVHVGHTIGIMKQGRLIHRLVASSVSAAELQQLYLATI